jgi:hypothetical protein
MTFSGGEISGNSLTRSGATGGISGAGIHVDNSTLTMTGGKISGNTGESGNTSNVSGGGVRMQNTSTMIFSGGEISGNSLTSSAATGEIRGAGIHVDNSTLTMTGGKISGNTGEAYGGSSGGGVRLVQSTMTFSGGEISGNSLTGGLVDSSPTSDVNGAGVEVSGYSTLTMTGGNISGNTGISVASRTLGGGVRISSRDAAFIMNGGTIGGNTVRGNDSAGGGVYVPGGSSTSVFEKIPAEGSVTSGTVYGSDEGANSNKVENSAGEAVAGKGNAVSAPSAERDSTLGSANSFVFP